jgi:hypothetical protein
MFFVEAVTSFNKFHTFLRKWEICPSIIKCSLQLDSILAHLQSLNTSESYCTFLPNETQCISTASLYTIFFYARWSYTNN